MDKSMAELVLLAQAGDRSTVSRLYEQSYSSVYQAVRAIVQDEDQAQDIVQDSFIKGFRELDALGDPEQRMAVIMYYYEELSIRQIAGEQGCSENTVKSRLKYAREREECSACGTGK